MLAQVAEEWTARFAAFRAKVEADLEEIRRRKDRREETVAGLLVSQIRELQVKLSEHDRQLEELRQRDDRLFALVDSDRAPW